jgi:demethylmenaquinone methyltransferase/2-methoxy-6-polyprenyl-1,4-benzoquinol methylase
MPEGMPIQQMFATVAPRYDLLNHLMSFGLDRYWWRAMARLSGAAPGTRFLDVAAGTGDSSIALARRGACVISSDFTLPMLRLGNTKFARKGYRKVILASVGADALRLPFKDERFDGLSICYGLRNLTDRSAAYAEFLRVLKPGGRLTILEFSRPRRAWLRRLYEVYSFSILPAVGTWISGDAKAYHYLPESIRTFPDQVSLAVELESSGFVEIRWKNLSGGIVAVHTASKPDIGSPSKPILASDKDHDVRSMT